MLLPRDLRTKGPPAEAAASSVGKSAREKPVATPTWAMASGEARVQRNGLQAPQRRATTQPGWGVRSLTQRAPSPEAQRQQNGEQTAAI